MATYSRKVPYDPKDCEKSLGAVLKTIASNGTGDACLVRWSLEPAGQPPFPDSPKVVLVFKPLD